MNGAWKYAVAKLSVRQEQNDIGGKGLAWVTLWCISLQVSSGWAVCSACDFYYKIFIGTGG